MTIERRRNRRLLLGLVSVAVLLAHCQAVDPHYREVSIAAGLGRTEGDKTGSPAIGDLDGNGFMDIVMCNHARGPFEVFKGSHTGFVRTVIFPQKADKHGVGIGDYNGDGLPDITLAVAGGSQVEYPSQPVLGKSLPNGTFQRVEGFELGLDKRVIRGVSIRYLDADRDGDLDMFILGRKIPSQESRRHGIFENLGNGQFAVRPNSPLEYGLSGTGHLVADYNDDGYPDIFLVAFGIQLFENDGNWRFIDVTDTVLPHQYKKWFSSGAELDYDNDGDMDFYFGGGNKDKGPYNDGKDVLLENRGGGVLVDVSHTAGLPVEGVHPGITVGDFNNDGFVDVFLPRAGPNDTRIPDLIMLNQGDKTFRTLTNHGANGPTEPGQAAGAQAFDYNRDGRLDLAVGSRLPNVITELIRGRLRLFKNRTPRVGNYVTVHVPVMSTKGETTMDAEVLITMVSGERHLKKVGSVGEGRVQSFVNDVHFGVGNATRIESVRLTLSTGRTSKMLFKGAERRVNRRISFPL